MSVTFPNVPNFPGVPQLARAALPNPKSILVAGGGAILSAIFGAISSKEVWGIMDVNGEFVLVADSILEFEHHPKWDVPDFPIQGDGKSPTSFASYNKVKLPFSIRVRFAIGSSLYDRQQFLKNLDAAADSVTGAYFNSRSRSIDQVPSLYTIVTPERSYPNSVIEFYDIARTSQGLRATGAYFLTEIDVYFRQVIPVQAQYSTTNLKNAQSASAQPQAATGAVLPQDLSSQIQSEASNASYSGAFGSF